MKPKPTQHTSQLETIQRGVHATVQVSDVFWQAQQRYSAQAGPQAPLLEITHGAQELEITLIRKHNDPTEPARLRFDQPGYPPFREHVQGLMATSRPLQAVTFQPWRVKSSWKAGRRALLAGSDSDASESDGEGSSGAEGGTRDVIILPGEYQRGCRLISAPQPVTASTSATGAQGSDSTGAAAGSTSAGSSQDDEVGMSGQGQAGGGESARSSALQLAHAQSRMQHELLSHTHFLEVSAGHLRKVNNLVLGPGSTTRALLAPFSQLSKISIVLLEGHMPKEPIFPITVVKVDVTAAQAGQRFHAGVALLLSVTGASRLSWL